MDVLSCSLQRSSLQHILLPTSKVASYLFLNSWIFSVSLIDGYEQLSVDFCKGFHTETWKSLSRYRSNLISAQTLYSFLNVTIVHIAAWWGKYSCFSKLGTVSTVHEKQPGFLVYSPVGRPLLTLGPSWSRITIPPVLFTSFKPWMVVLILAKSSHSRWNISVLSQISTRREGKRHH